MLSDKQPTNKLVYVTFMLIGASYLWPWNCFLSAISYFYSRIEDEKLRGVLNSSLMFISTITSTLVFFYLADKQRNANYPRRIIYGEVITAIVFLFLSLTCFTSFLSDKMYFAYILFSMFVATVGTSYTQNGSFAVVALYEPVYMQAVMVGQAMAGIVPPLGSMLSALSYGNSESQSPITKTDGASHDPPPIDTNSSLAQWSSFSYFIAATSLSLGAICMYVVSINKIGIIHEPDEGAYLRYADEIEGQEAYEEEEEESSSTYGETSRLLSHYDERPLYTKPKRPVSLYGDSTAKRPASLYGDSTTKGPISRPKMPRRCHTHHPVALVQDEEAMARGEHHTSIPLSELFRKLWVPSMTVYLVFTVTLAYPVFASRILSSTLGLPPQLFIPLVFLVWNFGDLIGRIICAFPKLVITSDRALIGYGIGRLVFIPLFVLISMWKTRNDVVYLMLHMIFGITNGHLCSSAFIQMPKYVDEKEREAGGGFMTLLLSSGLTTGSLISFGLSAIVSSVSV